MKRRVIGLLAGAALATAWYVPSATSVMAAPVGGGMVNAVASTGSECQYRPDQVIATAGLAKPISKILGIRVAEQGQLVPEKLFGIYPPEVPILSVYTVNGIDPLTAAIKLDANGISAAPNYLSSYAPGVRTWAPGEDAVIVPGPYPLVGAPTAGVETRIGVLDTGLTGRFKPSKGAPGGLTYVSAQAAHSELAGEGLVDATYAQPLELTSGRAAGHGTFITTLIRRTLPAATIRVAQVPFYDASDASVQVDTSPLFATDQASRVDDAALTFMMHLAFVSGNGSVNIDALSLSFGSYGCDTEFEPGAGEGDFRTPIGVRNALLAMRKLSGGTLMVSAAAGNDLTDERFYPAAFAANECFEPATAPTGPAGPMLRCAETAKAVSPWVAAVTSPASKLGPYSNFGDWTNVEAQGSDVYGQLHNLKWAGWSGTSFAAPCAAAIADSKGITDWNTQRGVRLDCGLG